MTRLRRFKQVDVFTAEPLKGNALAVILDSEGLTDAEVCDGPLDQSGGNGVCAQTGFTRSGLPCADFYDRQRAAVRRTSDAGHGVRASCKAG